MRLTDALPIINSGLSQPVPYHRMLELARQGVVPVARNDRGTRWEVAPEAIPEIQAVLRGTSAPAEPVAEVL